MSTQLTGAVVVAAQALMSESSTALHNLGELVFSNDGRAYRYAKAGVTALVAGKLQQSSAEDTTNFQNLTCAVSSAGATSITTTSTVTLTVNQLAGALLTVTAATTGAGFLYKVKSHAAATAAVVTFNLEDPVVVATTGTVTVDLAPNAYSAVIVNPTTATSAPIGVAVYNITGAYFGWLQVGGVASILNDAGSTVGTNVSASNATAGAVEAAVTAQAAIGVALTGIATTEYGLVKLFGL